MFMCRYIPGSRMKETKLLSGFNSAQNSIEDNVAAARPLGDRSLVFAQPQAFGLCVSSADQSTFWIQVYVRLLTNWSATVPLLCTEEIKWMRQTELPRTEWAAGRNRLRRNARNTHRHSFLPVKRKTMPPSGKSPSPNKAQLLLRSNEIRVILKYICN